jgi:hypothetical protein
VSRAFKIKIKYFFESIHLFIEKSKYSKGTISINASFFDNTEITCSLKIVRFKFEIFLIC